MLPFWPSNKLVKILLVIFCSVLVLKILYYIIPYARLSSTDSHADWSPELHKKDHEEEMVTNVAEPLRITVFYEALCPDSRDFITHDLVPMVAAIGDIVDVEMVPYGKAKSSTSEDGRRSFTCQHGPRECSANIVHACVLSNVKDFAQRVNLVGCMIKRNFQTNKFITTAQECLTKLDVQVPFEPIEECSKGSQGEEILYHMGKMTHDLQPTVDFIPTITINDMQIKYFDLVRKFIPTLCNMYKGPRPDACPKDH